MKHTFFLFSLLLYGLAAAAQNDIQIIPGQVGAYGATAGSFLRVAATPALGGTWQPLATVATDLGTAIVLGGDLSGTPGNAQIVANAVGTNELASAAVTMPKIAQAGATSGQVIKWNGSAWAPADDAGTTYTAGTGISIASNVITNTGDLSNTNEIQTISRNAANNTVTLSNSGGSFTSEDLFVEGVATFTAGQSTATMSGTLPTEDAKIWVYRNGIRHRIASAGCTGCVTRSGLTLTFGSSLASGEQITFKHPAQ